jgi:MFS family permease
MILPLFGGYLIDYVGIRISIIIFSSLLTAGQAIFAFGCSISSYPVAIVGRFVFGLGGESLNVGQSTIVTNWFRGQELAMALAINVGVSRVGSVLNDWTEPAMADGTGSVVFGLWVGFIICVCSLCAGLIVTLIDKRADVAMGIKGKQQLDPSERVKLSDVKKFKPIYWFITINCCVVYICVLCFNNVASNFF